MAVYEDEQDDGLMIYVPPDWQVWGWLPPTFDVMSPEQRAPWLVPGLVEIHTADGLWTFTIDWCPAGDPHGAFRCRLIAQHDPDHPVEEYLFATVANVHHWLQRTIDHLA